VLVLGYCNLLTVMFTGMGTLWNVVLLPI